MGYATNDKGLIDIASEYYRDLHCPADAPLASLLNKEEKTLIISYSGDDPAYEDHSQTFYIVELENIAKRT